MADFTIILVGFDHKALCALIEPVYVPEALDQTQASAGGRRIQSQDRHPGSGALCRCRPGQPGEDDPPGRVHLNPWSRQHLNPLFLGIT